jgi:(p)ppGpp synthase/HD superfamily hydrolase
MKIHNAIIFASIKHQNQKRKGTNLPYIVHPMEVMQILTENGCNENVIVAGILHDTLEDTDTTPQEIEKEFGKEILAIVQSESEDKSKTWKERKQHTIDCLKTDSLETKLVCCADKLSNIRSMYVDFQNCGAELWKRFNASKEDIGWYYHSIADNLSGLEGYKMYDELQKYVGILF